MAPPPQYGQPGMQQTVTTTTQVYEDDNYNRVESDDSSSSGNDGNGESCNPCVFFCCAFVLFAGFGVFMAITCRQNRDNAN